jgi:mannose-6-phosphate isomerase-like protein (cupin superfamily)
MASKHPDGGHFTEAQAAALPLPPGRRSAEVYAHGSMTLRYYKPPKPDPQTPHDQDELYVVTSGTGFFVCGAQRYAIATGDVLFAPANAVHRFEDGSDDLAVWVVFYGPTGGEATA